MSEKPLAQSAMPDIKIINDALSAEYGELPPNHMAIGYMDREVGALAGHPVMSKEGTLRYIDRKQNAASPEHPAAQPIIGAVDTLKTSYLDVLQSDVDAISFFDSKLFLQMDKDTAAVREAVKHASWADMPVEALDRTVRQLAALDATERLVHESKQMATFERPTLEDILISSDMPSRTLEALYQYSSPDDDLEGSFIQNKLIDIDTTLNQRFDVLKKAYKNRGGLDCVEKGQDRLLDMTREKINSTEFLLASIDDRPEDFSIIGIEHHDNLMRKRIDHFLRDELGLDDSTIERFTYSAYSRFLSRDDTIPCFIDGSEVRNSLINVAKSVKAQGAENIQWYADRLGLVNIDRYSPEDLDTLCGIASDDKQTIEHLKNGDVTVVFVDAFGDHNGAFKDVASQFRKESGRTIIFEIEQPETIYRRMLYLQKKGIKPSTLVLAAHGSPGQTHFGQGAYGFNLISSQQIQADNDGRSWAYLDQARLDRLVGDEFMQPNRGIDSTDEQIGRREIIISSCSSDKEFEGIMSISEAVLTSIGRTDARVYGAGEVMYSRRGRGPEANTVGFYNYERPRDSFEHKKPTKRASNAARQLSLVEPTTLERLKSRLTGKPVSPVVKRRQVKSIVIDKKKEAA